ncbi:hypothetical protein E4U41_004571 [Claviceps citrina]|nr:hypothetical protein E4U41_004571 [Claviceps citrina]
MTDPRGESSWVAYLEESTRNVSDLEHRVNVIELYQRAVSAEPASLRLWLSYCNFFQSLWENSNSDEDGWSEEEKMMGQELFSLDATLELWQQGYEAIRYRLTDSHELWNRWISLEMYRFRKTQTSELLDRVTRLYRERLATPHLTWDETSQSFSSFLSEYMENVWEETMQQITISGQQSKRAVEKREPFELKLMQAERNGDIETQRSLLREYIDWEVREVKKRKQDDNKLSIRLCSALFDRALTGLFATDEDAWQEYIVFLSSSSDSKFFLTQGLDACRRAVQHCPASGHIWTQYILCAEEAGLSFDKVEAIKDAATVDDKLCNSGMESMIEVYSAWCSYLRRTTVKEDDGIALSAVEGGIKASMASVMQAGKRLYGKSFLGDPKYRLERIYIQFLTETKSAPEEARSVWKKLERNAIYADSYDFWLNRYTWEMLVFMSEHFPGVGHQSPSKATATLLSAATRKSIDWPERILEIYSLHCSLYETPEVVRQANDLVHQTRKAVTRRRQWEEQAQAAQYAALYEAQAQTQTQAQAEPQPPEQPGAEMASSPSGSKRKRESSVDAVQQNDEQSASKRQRNGHEAVDGTAAIEPPKRDRENSTILVTNLPFGATQTETRKYFRPYGHINNITAFYKDEDKQSTTALIEFRSAEEAQSALLRDAKYFGESQISVQSGHDLTVYVANYPPAADEKYIRELFQDCGQILSIRWPSLKVNTHRRFCYVSFADREASARAVAKEGRLLDGKFKLLARYSNPNQKKNREGAIAEGREVHVSNLDQAASEAEIRHVFGKFGTVQRVTIPQSMAGRNRGFAFLELETKEQASKAVEQLDNTKFRSQILKVQVSKENKVKPSAKSSDLQRPSASPAPGPVRDLEDDEAAKQATPHTHDKPSLSDVASRTIALMGLPDTVNDARVRALVEPLGAIVKLIHQPCHGGAIIEFADVSAAGKAALQLNSMEYEGHVLRTGSPDELRQNRAANEDHPARERTAPRPDGKQKPAGFMPPPRAVHRQARGRSGPKRALGFAPRTAAPSSGPSATDKETMSGAPQKSNADFKAMFLAGKKDGVPRE